jgi:hypothetical protein
LFNSSIALLAIGFGYKITVISSTLSVFTAIISGEVEVQLFSFDISTE